MSKKPAIVSLNLRLPAGLHKMLVKSAESKSPPTSLNSEILGRLYDSFEPNRGKALEGQYDVAAENVLDRLNEFQRQIAKIVERALAEKE